MNDIGSYTHETHPPIGYFRKSVSHNASCTTRSNHYEIVHIFFVWYTTSLFLIEEIIVENEFRKIMIEIIFCIFWSAEQIRN